MYELHTDSKPMSVVHDGDTIATIAHDEKLDIFVVAVNGETKPFCTLEKAFEYAKSTHMKATGAIVLDWARNPRGQYTTNKGKNRFSNLRYSRSNK